MTPGPELVGALLAGGRGRRLGRGDKGLVELCGRPMIERVHARMVPQVGRIALNVNGDPERFRFLDARVVPDSAADAGGAGPLAGVCAVLTWARRVAGPSTRVLTVPVDAPFLPADLAVRLVAACGSSEADIAVASSGGRRHPVVACWPVSLAADLRRALDHGVRKIDAFTADYRVRTAEWGTDPVDPFFNVNTSDDLRRAEALLAAGRTPRPPRPDAAS